MKLTIFWIYKIIVKKKKKKKKKLKKKKKKKKKKKGMVKYIHITIKKIIYCLLKKEN